MHKCWMMLKRAPENHSKCLYRLDLKLTLFGLHSKAAKTAIQKPKVQDTKEEFFENSFQTDFSINNETLLIEQIRN